MQSQRSCKVERNVMSLQMAEYIASRVVERLRAVMDYGRNTSKKEVRITTAEMGCNRHSCQVERTLSVVTDDVCWIPALSRRLKVYR
jgi:hypothetical protein